MECAMVSFSGGGGLKFWLENYSTAIQTNVSFTPKVADANVSVIFQPKGTGAILAQIPTGTTVGGNARGTYSVDFQMGRNNANQVASGNYSVIAGGINNRASGNTSFVGAGASLLASGGSSGVVSGTSNTASGNNSFIGGGQSSTASGADSFIGGGNTNTVSGQYGTIGGGQLNTISINTYGVIAGGERNTVTGQYGVINGGLVNTCGSFGGGVLAGRQNSVNGGTYDLVAGGYLNTISFAAVGNNQGRLIVGGTQNTIDIGGNEHTCIVGGNNNFIGVLANYAFIGGGRNNSCTGLDSTLVGGSSNRIGNGSYQTATQSFLGGGNANVIEVNSTYAVLGGGQSNQVTASFASVLGGQSGVSRLYGQQSYAAGGFAAAGDAQAHELIWRRAITGTAQTELFLDGASIAAILPATNAIWQGTIDVAAICTTTGNGTTTVGAVEATSYKVTIKRIGTTTSLVGTVQEIGTTNADASMSTGVFTIDNNDANESLRIQFTPPVTAGSTTVIRVVATFRGLQIQY